MNRCGKFRDRVRNIEKGKRINRFKPLTSSLRIAGSGFVHDELRDEQLEFAPARSPPFLRDLLMRGDDEVSTWPSGQVAWNRRLDVHARLHGPIVPVSRDQFNGHFDCGATAEAAASA